MAKRSTAGGDGMVRVSLFLRPEQLTRLRAVQDETGAPVAEQIRRAIDAALGSKPVRKGGRP
jgi:hypothetical protein